MLPTAKRFVSKTRVQLRTGKSGLPDVASRSFRRRGGVWLPSRGYFFLRLFSQHDDGINFRGSQRWKKAGETSGNAQHDDSGC
jgi:hypothetical protein